MDKIDTMDKSNKSNKLKKYCRKIFILPVWFVILLSSIAFPLVIYALYNFEGSHPISVISYLLSAYAFVIFCVRLPYMYKRSKELLRGDELKLVVRIRKILYKYKYTRIYVEDSEFRGVIALYSGVGINAFYAIYRCGSGIYYKSNWFFAIGIYYLIFGIIRFMLIRRMKRSETICTSREKDYYTYKTYRFCGVLMLLMNLAMSIMIIQMVVNKETFYYDSQLIYFSAIYTFYYVLSSVDNLLKFAKKKNPILTASKYLTCAGALMSMFTLQTSMIALFGDNELERDIMNAVTGGIVTAIVIFMAIFMIVNGSRKLKNWKKNI